jgi:ABC-type multidrug transport system fused ATPase/permease subunit
MTVHRDCARYIGCWFSLARSSRWLLIGDHYDSHQADKFMKTLSKLLNFFTPPERRQAYLLLGMIVVMATFDAAGVASIMPFMAVLGNPELIETNRFFNLAYTKLGFTDPQQFIFAMGIFVFVMLLVSLSLKALTTYAQLRFSLMREHTIGKRLLEGYLNQPYSWFLSRHSADLQKTILSEVNQVINTAIKPIMNLIAHGAVVIALLTLLIFIDPKLALTVCFTLVAAYSVIYTATRRHLARIGKVRVQANQARFTAVSEVFGAYKEVKVGGLEQSYVKRFAGPSQTYAFHQATAQVVSQLPRFALEATAFGGMLLVVLYLIAQSGSIASTLPVIALYAFAGYRLMPALQQVYGAVSQMRFAGPALDALHADLLSLRPAHPTPSKHAMVLQQAITLDQIHYNYPKAIQPSLKGLSLIIPAKSTVGLVGATGSGKTTTVDLILGLLEAQQGTLAVDGEVITEQNRRSWQRSIGYVPQQIYLADDTVAGNIAFGLETKDIDQAAVEHAAKIANLHDFVTKELPEQYQTTVGERGVRLSGGQRQRIGIARALYHDPQVLILDEATSALDNLTEQAVMEAVNNLEHEITIILIAHRLGTVRACDTIFLLEKGELTAQGTFDELKQANEQFRAMAAGH